MSDHRTTRDQSVPGVAGSGEQEVRERSDFLFARDSDLCHRRKRRADSQVRLVSQCFGPYSNLAGRRGSQLSLVPATFIAMARRAAPSAPPLPLF